jgi:hypothetical protein
MSDGGDIEEHDDGYDYEPLEEEDVDSVGE